MYILYRKNLLQLVLIMLKILLEDYQYINFLIINILIIVNCVNNMKLFYQASLNYNSNQLDGFLRNRIHFHKYDNNLQIIIGVYVNMNMFEMKCFEPKIFIDNPTPNPSKSCLDITELFE